MKKTKIKMKNKKITSRPGRRTQDEISIGMTIEEKRAGMTYEDKLEGRSVSDLKAIKKIPGVKTLSVKSLSTDDKTNKPTEIVTSKVVILKDKKTVQEILNKELEKCSWDWKFVDIDQNFKLSQLTKLGKDDWKFAFIYEPQAVNPNSKRPSVVCLTKVLKKGK